MKQPNVYVYCLCIYIQLLLQLHQCYAVNKCNRITFDNLLSEDTDVLSTVYIRTRFTNNGFPVFEDEKGRGIYFTARNSRLWYFSKGSVDYGIGLFSETSVNMNELDRKGYTRMALRYCPVGQFNKYGLACYNDRIRGTTMVRCVPGMTDCGNKQIRYIQGNKHIILTREKKTAGRAEYYNMNLGYRLYYNIISVNWVLKSTETGVVINSVFSKARKPEYITAKWRRTWCTCKQGYYGGYCEFTKHKQTSQPLTTTGTATDWQNQNKKSGFSIDGTEKATILKVLVILVPLFLCCTHICGSCMQSEKTSCSRITSKHAYVGELSLTLIFLNLLV